MSRKKYTKKGGGAEGFGGRVFPPENLAQRRQILDTVLAIASELGVSAGQVALAWAGSHGAVPIIGPRTLSQISDNLGALSFELSPGQIERLDAVSSVVPTAAPWIPISWGAGDLARHVA